MLGGARLAFFFLPLGGATSRGRGSPRRGAPATPATAHGVRPTEMRRTEMRISGWGLLLPKSFAATAAGLAAEQGFGLGWTRGSGEGNGGAAGREGSLESGASIHGLGLGRGWPERGFGCGGRGRTPAKLPGSGEGFGRARV